MTGPDPVAVLAAQLEELRGQLAQLRAQVETDGHGVAMTALLKAKELGERLDEALEKNRIKPPPAPWWVVGEAEGRAMLAELREWVEGFARRHYPGYMKKIPGCWPNHPEAVWELSTIWVEWQRVYADEDNRDLQAALTWHDRWFPAAIRRLADSISCDEAGCRITRPRSY